VTRLVTTLTAGKEERRGQRRAKNRAEHHAELLMSLANQRKCKRDAATLDDADAFSVEEFCRRHRISVQVFYKYPDLMPDSFYVGARRLISKESAARWRAARELANARAPP
jgi:hypothetical protein